MVGRVKRGEAKWEERGYVRCFIKIVVFFFQIRTRSILSKIERKKSMLHKTTIHLPGSFQAASAPGGQVVPQMGWAQTQVLKVSRRDNETRLGSHEVRASSDIDHFNTYR